MGTLETDNDGNTRVSTVLHCPSLKITLHTGALHPANLVALGIRMDSIDSQQVGPAVIATGEHPLVTVLARIIAGRDSSSALTTSEVARVVSEEFGNQSVLPARAEGNQCWNFPPEVIWQLKQSTSIDELVEHLEYYLVNGLASSDCNGGMKALAIITIRSAITEIQYLKCLVKHAPKMWIKSKSTEDSIMMLGKQVFSAASKKPEVIDLMKVVVDLLRTYAEKLVEGLVLDGDRKRRVQVVPVVRAFV